MTATPATGNFRHSPQPATRRRRTLPLALAAGLAAVPVVGAASPSRADETLPPYPAAQCAAFWFGWDDYARRSALLDPMPGDLARAEAYARAARRLSAGGPSQVDAFIAEQRGLMLRMIDEAMVGPGANRSLMERLMETCDDFAATQPETADLR